MKKKLILLVSSDNDAGVFDDLRAEFAKKMVLLSEWQPKVPFNYTKYSAVIFYGHGIAQKDAFFDQVVQIAFQLPCYYIQTNSEITIIGRVTQSLAPIDSATILKWLETNLFLNTN